MGGIRPTQFTQLTTLAGGVELYTQVDGAGNAKLTIQQVADFTKDQFSAAAVVETVAYKLSLLDVPWSATPQIEWDKIYIPNPQELHPDANKIEVMIVASVYAEFVGQNLKVQWYEPISGTVDAIDYQPMVNNEIVKSGWIVPEHTGLEVQLLATNGVFDSQADVMTLFESSIVLIRATKV